MTKKNKKQTADNPAVKKEVHELIKKIDADPQNSENYLKLATYIIKQGDVYQATQLLEQAMRVVKQPKDLNYDLAVCYYLQGNFDQALKLLNQIPNDDFVLYQKALVFYKTGQQQKALAHALTIKHTDNKVLELIGDIWLGLGELDQAQATYKQISPDERSAKVNFMLGITILTSDREKAEKYLDVSKKQDSEFFKRAKKQYASILKLVSGSGKKNG